MFACLKDPSQLFSWATINTAIKNPKSREANGDPQFTLRFHRKIKRHPTTFSLNHLDPALILIDNRDAIPGLLASLTRTLNLTKKKSIFHQN
jgi:hypothetical protein